jgi:choloylglycine hydrolase
MDWHDNHNVPVFVPRGYEWASHYDQGIHKNLYALIGSGFQRGPHVDVSDGVNEFGLSAQKLTFANATHYADVPQEEKTMLAPFEFAFWLLGNFKTVAEVRSVLPRVLLMAESIQNNSYRDSELHFVVGDPTGDFVLIEPTSMPMMVVNNPIGVATNAPRFNREVEKLEQYLDLDASALVSGQPPKNNRVSTGDFSGKNQVPGGYTPSNRFIRATYLKERIDPAADESESIVNAWHLLNSVTVPKSLSRSNTYTVYRAAAALESRTLYFESYSSGKVSSLTLTSDLANHPEVEIYDVPDKFMAEKLGG